MFNNINVITEEEIYWMGFFAADDFLEDKESMKCILHNKDKEHLEQLIKYNFNTSVKSYKASSSGKIVVTKGHIDNSILTHYKITKPKSLTYNYNFTTDKYLDTFFLGYFDEDGCIYAYKQATIYQLSIPCAHTFAPMLVKYFNSYGFNHVLLQKDKTDNYIVVRIQSECVIIFLGKLYLKHNYLPVLKRKFYKYLDILSLLISRKKEKEGLVTSSFFRYKIVAT